MGKVNPLVVGSSPTRPTTPPRLGSYSLLFKHGRVASSDVEVVRLSGPESIACLLYHINWCLCSRALQQGGVDVSRRCRMIDQFLCLILNEGRNSLDESPLIVGIVSRASLRRGRFERNLAHAGHLAP